MTKCRGNKIMIEFVLFLIPGAITWLLVNGLGKKKTDNGLSDILQFLVYVAINTGLMWFILYKRGMVSDWIISEEGYFLAYTGENFFLAIVISVILGIAVSLLRRGKIRIQKNEQGFYWKLTEKQKKWYRILLVLLVLIITSVLTLKPSVEEMVLKNRKNAFQIAAVDFLKAVQQESEDKMGQGITPEELGDLEIAGVCAKRVTEDQSWTTASPNGKTEAVYMADANGDIVYVSYRNKYYVGTWSGESTDETFIQNHGGWNSGMGYGWSGMGM